ncbi:hypothetical protein ASZ78_001058 [Callipepla squamata]|uniref:Uncharacterized protein n=1 Tax=Callipepla squamata TaxID=9009 RepID=A0A226N8V7_CALSU|nr:hypothetical protein ASZ78_001058 [Callipepla squamata]
MEWLRTLRGLFAFVGCIPRHTCRWSRGRVASRVPLCAMSLLLQRLQDKEGDREQVYCELESVLREEDSRLPCGVLNRLLAEVSQDLMAAQGVAIDVKMAASNILVALARSHFSFVMAELQSQLKAVGKSREFVLITLSRLFSIYALQCIPFVWLTLAGLCSVVGQTKSGQTLRFACAVVKQWSEGIRVHLCSGKQCPWPATEKERILEKLYQLFCSVERNWQGCKEEKDKKAVLEAVVAMMAVLLEKELHREHIWEQLLWLTHQYQEVQDTSGVTKSLIVFLEALKGVQPGIPRDKFLAITSAVFYQLSDDTKQHSEADSAELTHCILLQAQICPEEMVLFLQSQLSDEREARCVAALGLLGVLARSDEHKMTEKLPQVVEAVQRLCGDPRTQVRKALLHFIKDLLSVDARSCSAWDVVGHIFSEFSHATRRMAAGDLSAQEAREEGALQELCMNILGSLDVSVRGMTKLLWPRLMLYVVPAQYTGMLIPVSRCIQALAERKDLAARETEELDSHFLNSLFQGPLLTPQTLLVRLLVAAGSPFAGSELRAAALLLMQNLHSKIHGAVGAMWAAEIPLLLHCLQATDESFTDSVEWEHRLLKFLKASLETMEDEAWTKHLCCELSCWLGRSDRSSGEKVGFPWLYPAGAGAVAGALPTYVAHAVFPARGHAAATSQVLPSLPLPEQSFLYKALGTALGACKDVLHIQEELLQHLEEANAEGLSEVQETISLLSHAAESNFHPVLDTLTMFASRLCKGQNARISRRKKMELDSTRAPATCSALILAHGSLALRASKEQILTHVEMDMVGNILLLYSCSCQDLQNKLALVQSIANVSSAFQAAGDSCCFNTSLKDTLLEILMDMLKEYYLGTPVSPVPLKVVLALEQLSKLKPSLESKDTLHLLNLCWKNIVTNPSAEMMLKMRKSQRAAQYLQLLQTSVKALSRFLAVLIETDSTGGFFQNIIYVLQYSMTTDNVWERKRAMQVCFQLLAICEEHQRTDIWKYFGSLVGVLAPLTCDPMPTSRQLAASCLSSLLRIRAKVTNRVTESGDIESLCEGLNSCSTASQLQTSSKIAWVSGPKKR